jgi:hypothetical protein
MGGEYIEVHPSQLPVGEGEPETVVIAMPVDTVLDEDEFEDSVGFENPGYQGGDTPVDDEDQGEIISQTGRNSFSTVVSAFSSRLELMARLDGSYQEEPETQVIKNPCLFWQRPCSLWLVVHGREDHEEQFNIETVEARVTASEHERQRRLAKFLDVSETEVSPKDRRTFTAEFVRHRDIFYNELLKLAAVELGLDSATDKLNQVLSLILEDSELRAEFVRIKATMRDLVDIRFTNLLAKTLSVDIGSEQGKSQLHDVLSLLGMQRPEERPVL